jgi:hypothetical protein
MDAAFAPDPRKQQLLAFVTSLNFCKGHRIGHKLFSL